jgi:hypothetical protein
MVFLVGEGFSQAGRKDIGRNGTESENLVHHFSLETVENKKYSSYTVK